ncbi:hypothetical protein PsorP6_005243 [Peronosclerospora sorghi]|uniref:Uncharacterized protein n=1 Tax=Peronosclerospora sorghi TaxID=230839 RepID=A0ACC0W8Q8_9STRA|nr:hypothetical protein PsorP6_005243 [Peronosclerospora sorghi]
MRTTLATRMAEASTEARVSVNPTRNCSITLDSSRLPWNPSRYEQRLRGSFEDLEDLISEERVKGGECDYRFETNTDTMSGIVGLREIEGAIWKDAPWRVLA